MVITTSIIFLNGLRWIENEPIRLNKQQERFPLLKMGKSIAEASLITRHQYSQEYWHSDMSYGLLCIHMQF